MKMGSRKRPQIYKNLNLHPNVSCVEFLETSASPFMDCQAAKVEASGPLVGKGGPAAIGVGSNVMPIR